MSDYIKVEDSFVEALIEQAAWDAVHVDVSEKKDSGQKKGDESKTKKGKKDFDGEEDKNTMFSGGKGKGKGVRKVPKKGAKVTQGGNVDKDGKNIPSSERDDLEDFRDDDRATHGVNAPRKESTEEHSCPLCESPLEEALTDEKVYEHIAQIRDALQSIEEEDEDLDEVNTKGPDVDANDTMDRAKALAKKGMKDADVDADDKKKEKVAS